MSGNIPVQRLLGVTSSCQQSSVAAAWQASRVPALLTEMEVLEGACVDLR